MNNGDHLAALHTDPDDLRERLWAYEDFSPESEHPGFDVTGAFASLGFIRAALKRSKRLWLATAAIGLVLGAGLYFMSPPKYQATTSIYFTNNPDMDALSAITTDQTLVSTRPIALKVMQQLGIGGSVNSFLSSYTTSIVTSQVLSITASGSSTAQAVSRAQAIATQFLAFRTNMLHTQLQQETATLGQEVTAAEQKVDSLDRQISRLAPSGSTDSGSAGSDSGGSDSSGSGSRGDQAKLANLRKQRTDAENNLGILQSTVQNSDAQAAVTTATMVNGTQIVDPATALPHSRFKYLVFYSAGGIFGGLAFGMAFVVIRALVSDRLRRRSDIATALGIPVKLSTGKVRGRNATGTTRAVGYLRSAIPSFGHSQATLAIVAVDNVRDVAELVTELARGCASEGLRVAIADLSPGAQAARELGATETGVHHVPVSSTGAPVSPLIAIVPERGAVAPGGPLRSSSGLAQPPDPALGTVRSSADLLITMLTLDPSTGGDHLSTWATDVVVVATAGRSSAERLYAVGELVRLAHPRSVSAILVNADRDDQSLGVPETPGQPSLTMPGY